MAAAQRPYAAAAFAATPSAPPAWNTLPCWYLLGTEDKRSHRPCSGSWPSARTPRLWRSRLRTSRSCPSLRPRRNLSCRQSRRPPQPPDQRLSRRSPMGADRGRTLKGHSRTLGAVECTRTDQGLSDDEHGHERGFERRERVTKERNPVQHCVVDALCCRVVELLVGAAKHCPVELNRIEACQVTLTMI